MSPKQPHTPQSPEDANAQLETGGEHGGGWDGEPTIPDEAAGANWNDIREDDDAADMDEETEPEEDESWRYD